MRRMLATVVALVLLVAVGWAAIRWLDGTPSDDQATAPPSASDAPPSDAPPQGDPARPDDAFAMTITSVYDGDTVQAQMVEPNDVVTTANPIRIRLVGVDAPEMDPLECYGQEATDALRALLPHGSTVWAAVDRDSWDDYGRRLLLLWTDDGRFVESELVRAGAVQAIRIWPNVEHHELLLSLEEQANAAGAGMWGSCG